MLAAEDSWPGHLSLLGNGSLVIEEFGWRDRGEYSCYVDNMLGNDTQSVQLELEPRYRHVIYMWSLLYGLVTAVSFLGNKNIPYGQSSAKLPVTRSLGPLSHSVTRSLGHSVTRSLFLHFQRCD